MEVKARAHSIRSVRDALLGLAYALAEGPWGRGLLVLADSRISDERLQREVRALGTILHPDLVDRLSVATATGVGFAGLPPDLGEDFRAWVEGLVRSERARGRVRRRTHLEILQVLVHEWLLGRGPVTSKWLSRTVGCSYPTVAQALRRFGHHVGRTSDRRVELRRFPREDWDRLLADADTVRGTLRFADRSGQPRPPLDLLRRLRRLGRNDVAVGGVLGAPHYHPGLDIVGVSRLDLTWHSPGRPDTPGFVERLDPALGPVPSHGHPAQLVVHVLQRADPMFRVGEEGVPWADPVECLLDLQEARLASQAEEFVAHMRGGVPEVREE